MGIKRLRREWRRTGENLPRVLPFILGGDALSAGAAVGNFALPSAGQVFATVGSVAGVGGVAGVLGQGADVLGSMVQQGVIAAETVKERAIESAAIADARAATARAAEAQANQRAAQLRFNAAARTAEADETGMIALAAAIGVALAIVGVIAFRGR